jgi:membrane protein
MNFLFQILDRILWPKKPPSSIGVLRAQKLARYPFALLRDLSLGELNLRAMSLVYTTMLAFVPMAFFVFAMAQVLGVHNQLEPIILGVLEPLGPRAAEVAANITGFFDNLSGGWLAAFSMGLLLLTVVSMAQKVESSFNYVFRVDRPRHFVRRFGEYLSVIIIGPLAMAISLGLIATLKSTPLIERLQGFESLAAWIERFGNTVPWLIAVSTFTALYLLIPNTRVRFSAAAIGGISAGIVWTAAGMIFASLVALSTRFEAIYSGYATVIILMLWLYLSWLILLLGLQFTFYLQHPFYLRYGHRTVPVDNSTRERLSLGIMLLVAREFAQPSHGWTGESLAAALRVPRHTVEPIIGALSHARLITTASDDRIIPARDIRGIRLAEIVSAVRGGVNTAISPAEGVYPAVEPVARRIDSAIAAELSDRSLADLLDESAG